MEKDPKDLTHEGLGIHLLYIKQAVFEINDRLTKMQEKFEKQYVSHEEFAPVKKLVYGFASVILSAVAVAIVAGVIITQK